MDFAEELKVYRDKIDKQLECFFSREVLKLKTDALRSFAAPVAEIICEFTMRGGKRIRPILVIMGYRLLKNSINENELNKVIKAACSVELMQSSFLIHDDIIDKADLRRNKPTVHKMLSADKAILAGNIAMEFGRELLLCSEFCEKDKIRALNKFNSIVEDTNYGQLLDIELSEKSLDDVSEADINNVHILKTAKYTIEGPLHLGALLAGACEDDLSKISEFAVPLGVAFQIHDDILGVFGEEEITGKPIFSDIEEGKKTLLVRYAFEHGTKTEKEVLSGLLGKKGINSDDFGKIKGILLKTKSLEHSKAMMSRLVGCAVKAIEDSTFNDASKKFLLEFSDYLLRRKY